MPSVQVFNKKWLTILVIFTLVGYILWRAIDYFIYLEQDIVRKENVGILSTLYITESSAGATTSYVYKYYLYPTKISDTIFLREVRNGYEPFLVTTDPDVKIKTGENSIHLKVSGEIFKFNNVAGYVLIYLNSSPF